MNMFYGIKEAAKAAGFSDRHFKRKIQDDKIPVMQIRRKFFILGRDLENWMRNHSHSIEEKQRA